MGCALGARGRRCGPPARGDRDQSSLIHGDEGGDPSRDAVRQDGGPSAVLKDEAAVRLGGRASGDGEPDGRGGRALVARERRGWVDVNADRCREEDDGAAGRGDADGGDEFVRARCSGGAGQALNALRSWWSLWTGGALWAARSARALRSGGTGGAVGAFAGEDERAQQ